MRGLSAAGGRRLGAGPLPAHCNPRGPAWPPPSWDASETSPPRGGAAERMRGTAPPAPGPRPLPPSLHAAVNSPAPGGAMRMRLLRESAQHHHPPAAPPLGGEGEGDALLCACVVPPVRRAAGQPRLRACAPPRRQPACRWAHARSSPPASLSSSSSSVPVSAHALLLPPGESEAAPRPLTRARRRGARRRRRTRDGAMEEVGGRAGGWLPWLRCFLGLGGFGVFFPPC